MTCWVLRMVIMCVCVFWRLLSVVAWLAVKGMFVGVSRLRRVD